MTIYEFVNPLLNWPGRTRV